MPNTAEKIFLQTDSQIKRLLYSSKVRKKIKEQLEDKIPQTSSYVLIEFKETVINDFAYVRDLILERWAIPFGDEEIRLSDLDRELSSAPGNYSPRSRSRLLLVSAAIKDRFPDVPMVSCSLLLQYLDLIIRVLLVEFFRVRQEKDLIFNMSENGCYIDSISCRLSRVTFSSSLLHYRKPWTCRLRKAECAPAKGFVEVNRSKLVAVENAMKQADPRKLDKKAFAALEEILDTKRLIGSMRCRRLADVIIGIQAPDDACILTTDKHFNVICSALGKRVCKL